jgi:phosphate transport system substrate-binding protein
MDEEGVTPIVATLALIVVAIIGGLTIAYLLGALSTDVSKRITAPDATPTPGPQILIVDSPQTYTLDQQLSQQYMATHGGVKVTLQSTPEDYTSTTSLSMNISDIVALPKAPSPSMLFKDPKIQTHFIGGRAVVVIANANMSISSLSQSDLSMVYSQTQQSLPANLTGLTMVVRNDDERGSEYIFAGWLTDDAATSLEGYLATPAGVQNYTAHSESNVISKISSTPGAIGFVSWASVANNNPAVSHIKVTPIVNKNNQMVQTLGENAIKGEMKNMSNAEYDDGLIGGLYYLTEGQPGQYAQSYIDWCDTSDAISEIHSWGMYGAVDLGTNIK